MMDRVGGELQHADADRGDHEGLGQDGAAALAGDRHDEPRNRRIAEQKQKAEHAIEQRPFGYAGPEPSDREADAERTCEAGDAPQRGPREHSQESVGAGEDRGEKQGGNRHRIGGIDGELAAAGRNPKLEEDQARGQDADRPHQDRIARRQRAREAAGGRPRCDARDRTQPRVDHHGTAGDETDQQAHSADDDGGDDRPLVRHADDAEGIDRAELAQPPPGPADRQPGREHDDDDRARQSGDADVGRERADQHHVGAEHRQVGEQAHHHGRRQPHAGPHDATQLVRRDRHGDAAQAGAGERHHKRKRDRQKIGAAIVQLEAE